MWGQWRRDHGGGAGSSSDLPGQQKRSWLPVTAWKSVNKSATENDKEKEKPEAQRFSTSASRGALKVRDHLSTAVLRGIQYKDTYPSPQRQGGHSTASS